MDHRAVHGVVLAAGLTAASLAPSAAPQQVFRTNTDIVSAYATVIDADGGIVTNLTRDDFMIFDNGRSQPLVQFESAVRPIRIVVMLDMSGSMMGNLKILRESAVEMFTRLLPDDLARVGSFGDSITITREFTNKTDDLIRSLWLDLKPGGGTPLWQAVNVAMTALAHETERRVVLVLSDGHDTGSLSRSGQGVTVADVAKRGQTEEIIVYAIGLASSFDGSGNRPTAGVARMGLTGYDGPDPWLHELARQTGGGYFELTDADALGPTFARVADELHRQYLLGYRLPDRDGRLHQIDVRVRGRTGLEVRARKAYLAPKAKTID
jgi:Ca-activated chloride channel homolog